MNPAQAVYDWYRSAIRNPKYRWWLILGTFLYLISPIDIAPDFIPIIGQIDDVILMTLLVSEVSQVLIEQVKRNKNSESPEVVANAQTAENPVDVNAIHVD